MSKADERKEVPDHEPADAALEWRGRGPTDEKGLEASQLPDGGKGTVDPHKELSRKAPEETGGVIGSDGEQGDVGLRGTPEAAEAGKSAGKGGGATGKAL